MCACADAPVCLFLCALCRMNPCTLGWYLPLLVQDVPGGDKARDRDADKGKERAQPGPSASTTATSSANTRTNKARANAYGGAHGAGSSTAGPAAAAGRRQRGTWQELDARFRRDLPDEAYVGRLGYRGLVMRACPRVRMLDGVEVSEKEREKAERLLRSVLGGPGAATGA